MTIPGNETGLAAGAFFVLVLGLALAMIPVVMFPILKKHNEALALGYVVFRGGLGAVGYLTIATGWLLLVLVSQIYVQAEVSGASGFEALGTLIFEATAITGGTIMTIVFCLGALMFNYLLYRTKLIPRWLSGWGLIAVVPYLSAGLLAMLGIIRRAGTLPARSQVRFPASNVLWDDSTRPSTPRFSGPSCCLRGMWGSPPPGVVTGNRPRRRKLSCRATLSRSGSLQPLSP